MSCSSESEGEIIEAKATTAQHHTHGNSINTPIRTPSASKSPILTLDGAYDRDRSRSPRWSASPRGEKRRHDDDRASSHRYYDRDDDRYSYRDLPRRYRHVSHGSDEFGRDDSRRNTYEGPARTSNRRNDYGGSRRDHRGYNDRRQGGRTRRREYYDYDCPDNNGFTNHREYDDRRYRSESRSRSRSPKRSRTENYRDRNDKHAHRERRLPHQERSHEVHEGSNHDKRQAKAPVSDRGVVPNKSRQSEFQAERFLQTSSQVSQLQPKLTKDGGSGALNLERTLPSTAEKDRVDKPTAEVEETHLANPEPVDEDTLIEQRRRERRRRVEEIKARHAAQTASPMQESQVITQSAADTPQTEGGTPQTRGLSDNGGSGTPSVVAGNTGADETTSSDGLPKTPAGSSEVGFRAEIAIQTAEELANLDNAIVETAGEDEPSAVDYNPTADMQADKMRELERRGEDMSAQDYKESEADTKQMLVSQGSTKEPLSDHKPQQSVKDIDMFAEDDDMFASESDIQTKPGVTQAPKVLNANMLDDWDTPDGYYKVILGELLDNRYHVTAKLGSGVFSGVIRAWDTKVENKEVAIKIIRNNESMKKAAFTELNVLNRLREQDPQDRRHVVRLERSFNHKGHLCMVFESLDVDLRSALKIHGKQSGLSIEAIRHFGRQMFLALLLFKQTDILHADLKPDNILLRDASKIIKICDLGSAVDISDVYANEPRPYLASRFYRAPELILGMKYDFAIDMWSIGCTLFELFTCRILFSGRHNNAMLRSMMECRGRFPQKLLKRASEAHYANNGIVEFPFNDMLDQFYSREEEKLTGRELGKWIPVTRLAERGRDLKSRIFAVVDVKRLKPSEHKELELLHDLLDKCLQLNPDKRLTPDQALQHAFLKNHTISKR